MRAEELARLEQASLWGRAGAPLIPPGSSDEADAIARLDELRELDLDGLSETYATRRRRYAREQYRRARSLN